MGIVEANGGPSTFFTEDFEGGLPGDWTVVTSQGCDWRDDNPGSRDALDGCSGIFMIADSDWCLYVDMDTELITPSINCFTYEKVILEFDHYFQRYSGGGDEKGDVDIWDGSTWHNKARYQSDTEGHVIIDISDIATGKSDVKIRWHYYDAYFDWYWEVDNVELSGTPVRSLRKYLHAEGGLIDLAHPIGTQWHELRPIFCREYHLSSWNDTSGDGVLSYCDRIDMYEKPDGELRPYHVEDVTITLRVTENETGESMYIELEGGYDPAILTAPNCTLWHEIYPSFCRQYHLIDWVDNDNGELGFCDHVLLTPKMYHGTLICPLDEDFSGSFPPSEWTTDHWEQWPYNYAGGTVPEALLYYYYISGDYAYLQSKPVDTTGVLCLSLEFKSYIEHSLDWWYWSYNCTVYTRANVTDKWTDVTPWNNPISDHVGPNTYSVDISSDIGSATQVLFEFHGDSEDITAWCVDDVRICYPASWWHVEDVATDIIVTPEPPPVGGQAYPVNKASLLAPWIAIALAAVLIAGGIILVRRRVQS